jgi:outer membrane protein OmpA-like peptidoglycan-associated protein
MIFLFLALLWAGPASLVPLPAHAQVTFDQRALEPLQKPPVTPEPAKPPAPARPAPPRPAAPVAPPQVRVPLAPPPAPVLPPALVVPTRPPAPPAPAPVAADAPGAAVPIQAGLRVTFGEARADLNPATESALRALAGAASGETSFTVAAFAPGAPEDPSTPRRLALSRALTVRAVLIAAGIPSVRIYVKALGASHGVEDGPADRVDVTLATQTASPP